MNENIFTKNNETVNKINLLLLLIVFFLTVSQFWYLKPKESVNPGVLDLSNAIVISLNSDSTYSYELTLQYIDNSQLITHLKTSSSKNRSFEFFVKENTEVIITLTLGGGGFTPFKRPFSSYSNITTRERYNDRKNTNQTNASEYQLTLLASKENTNPYTKKIEIFILA